MAWFLYISATWHYQHKRSLKPQHAMNQHDSRLMSHASYPDGLVLCAVGLVTPSRIMQKTPSCCENTQRQNANLRGCGGILGALVIAHAYEPREPDGNALQPSDWFRSCDSTAILMRADET